jgi:hypothetical protein
MSKNKYYVQIVGDGEPKKAFDSKKDAIDGLNHHVKKSPNYDNKTIEARIYKCVEQYVVDVEVSRELTLKKIIK